MIVTNFKIPNILVMALALLLCRGLAMAQTPVPTPQPVPTPSAVPQRTPLPEYIQRRGDTIRTKNAEASAAKIADADWVRRLKLYREYVKQLYRKPSEDEMKLLTPAGLGSGAASIELIKLIEDRGCSGSTNVVAVSEHCLKYSMPGGGSSYSFRVKSYRISRLADLTYSKGQFMTIGALVRGIMVDIGDVDLKLVTLNSAGLKFLREFETTSDREQAIKVDSDFLAGVTRDGLVYKRNLPAKLNSTYLLRSVAYRGSNYRSFEGVTYDEFSFDKRRDIIVAFRIVSLDPDGDVTIEWTEIDNKTSPVIKK